MVPWIKSRGRCGVVEGDRDAGFTLVEILVTLGILGMVLPALIVTFTTSSRNRASSELRTTAAYLLRDSLAELESTSPPDFPNTETVPFEEGSRFQRWASVEPTETDGLYDVVAGVIWLERGEERELAIRTLIADPAVASASSSEPQPGAQGR